MGYLMFTYKTSTQKFREYLLLAFLVLRRFFQKISSLCMACIQEWLVIKSGLWWRTYGIFSLKKNPKDWNDSWHKKFTLKVRFWHFLNEFRKYNFCHLHTIDFGQNPCFLGPRKLARWKVNLHYWYIYTLQM